MSIPDRFYRIAKHKLGEVKDWFDKVDEDEETEADAQRRTPPRPDARRELNDSLSSPPPATNPSAPRGNSSSVPMNAPRPSSGGASPYGSPSPYGGAYNSGTGGYTNSSGGGAQNTSANGLPTDPLDYHYKLLGLQAGADFGTVQAAYNKLAARSDPARFPAGSAEQQQAQQIRQRLDVSYKQLRDTLDSTASRFNLLEFDDVPKPRPEDKKNEIK